MELSKEYFYNREKIVLLVCDFYETAEIPSSMLEIKDNLALFPVANMPLIEYIMSNLYDQSFKNVIIAGKQINSVLKYIKSTKFIKLMNIRTFKCNGDNLGDVCREIDSYEYDFNEMIVMYANHFTNIPLNKLLKKHKKSRNIAMSLFVYNKQTNDVNTHVYGTKDNQILFYEKIQGNAVNTEEIKKCAQENGTLDIFYSYSSPTFAVISKPIFTMFTDNFDFRTLGDLLIGMLATGVYGYKFYLISQSEIEAMLKDKLKVESEYMEMVIHDGAFSSFYAETMYTTEEPEKIYSREFNTLLDYYHLNNDVIKMSTSIFRLQKVPEYMKGTTKCAKNVQNSIVGELSCVEGSLNNCIVWENVHVVDDKDSLIIIDDEKTFDFGHLESEFNTENSSQGSEPKRNDTFFDDFSEYLSSVAKHQDILRINFEDVFKQISLLRIVWNATKHELIEAFAFFFIDFLELNSLEETMSKASAFFGILSEFIETYEDQELLMECMHLDLHEQELPLKTHIFFNYTYLLVDAQIIDKSIVKKYNKMHKAGLF